MLLRKKLLSNRKHHKIKSLFYAPADDRRSLRAKCLPKEIGVFAKGRTQS